MTSSDADNQKKKGRSLVSNGKKLFLDGVELDGRSQEYRRYRDIKLDLEDQVGGNPSPAQMILIREAATLTLLSELDQAAVVGGHDVDETTIVKRTGALVRVLTTLGLNKATTGNTSAKVIVDVHAEALSDEV